MKWLLLGAVPVLLAAFEAQAQARPGSAATDTVGRYLDGQFIDVVNQCAGITRFRRNWQDIPSIPVTLRSSLGNDLSGGYQALNGRTLTDLYSAIWAAPATGSIADFGAYSRTTDGLGLRFNNADDRVVYGEANSTRHTHNCSTVVSFAVQAGAKLGGEQLAAALKASHDNTSNLNLSLVTGTFQSPVWDAFSPAPGRVPIRSNRFSAYAALWQWYAAEPDRADEKDKYFLLDEFDGLALYRFTGLTWKTTVGGSATAGGDFAVISASSSVRGQLDVNGSTSTNNFSVLRFARSTPVFRPLPDVETIAAGLAQTADFTQVGEWATIPVTNRTPLRLTHEIALPTRLCDQPGWTSNDAVTGLIVRSVPAGETGGPERCRFTATFTPSATPATGGSIPIQYEASLPFPPATPPASGTSTNRGIKLLVGEGEVLADYRARISLLPIGQNLRRAPGQILQGEATFRISTLTNTTVQSFAPAPTVYVGCEGEDPKLATAEVELVQTGSTQAPEARIRILQATTGLWERLTLAGGTCRISGQIQANVAGVSNPISVDIGVRQASVAGEPIAAVTLEDSAQSRVLLRLDAITPQ